MALRPFNVENYDVQCLIQAHLNKQKTLHKVFEINNICDIVGSVQTESGLLCLRV